MWTTQVQASGQLSTKELGCRLGHNSTAVTAAIVFAPLAPSRFATGKTPPQMYSPDIMTYHANFANFPNGDYFKTHAGGKEVKLRSMEIKGVPMWCLDKRPRGNCDHPYHCTGEGAADLRKV